MVEVHEVALEANKRDSATLSSQQAKYPEAIFGLKKKVANLEKRAEAFRAKDLYYTTNEIVLVEDAKRELLRMGHEVMDLYKEKET